MLNPYTTLLRHFQSQSVEKKQPNKGYSLIPIWQITVPLSVVCIFAMGSCTARSIDGGRYAFAFSITKEQISISTDIDMRDNDLIKGKDPSTNK